MNTKQILFSLALLGCAATSNVSSMEKKYQAAATGVLGLYSATIGTIYGILAKEHLNFNAYVYVADKKPMDSIPLRIRRWHLKRIALRGTNTICPHHALFASIGCGAVSLASMAKTYDLCKNNK